ncbi:hypothetical protein [Xanthomonas campestris]|uniref:hypothetical protein n=1 Tax=Xanthomonas TaxID=338 RepID=UPI001E3467C9|nr:hypothetical protein [Xanthomonas campestris]MCC5091135.1 hypothetical protein [Xanthomonas campestris]
MKRQSNLEYLRWALARSRQMRAVIEQMRTERPTSIEEKLAFSSMIESADTFIAYYAREIDIRTRRIGHRHRVRGAAAARRKADKPCAPGGDVGDAP